MSSYFVLLFAMLYFSPISQLWSVDKKLVQNLFRKVKKVFLYPKDDSPLFQAAVSQHVRSIIVFWGTPKLLPKSSSRDSKEPLKPMLIVFCAGHRKNAGVSFSVSKQSPPPSPGRELCSCLTLKEKARLSRESRESRGKVSSASSSLGAGNMN